MSKIGRNLVTLLSMCAHAPEPILADKKTITLDSGKARQGSLIVYFLFFIKLMFY